MATFKPQLTAIILTLDEAEHIVDCIESLRWADEIVVFDSYSEDGTVELAAAAGARVFQNQFQDYAQQRNDALDRIESDWVFFADADERATPTLAAEIRGVIGGRPEAGWYVPRRNIIFGRITRGAGWYPDYQLRLFRHDCVRYERPVHEIARVDGPVGHLHEPLIHYNYRDVAHFHEKQRAYTEYDASILRQQGVQPRVYTPWTQAARQFWWRFVALAGYRDGVHGLRLSLYMAYYEWLKYYNLLSALDRTRQ